jgi:chitinase
VGGGLQPGKPADKANYTLLLRELRKQLDAQGTTDGRPYLLTIAAPAGPTTYANLELAAVAATLDWINLMAYDFHGGWELATNFNAPMAATAADPSADPVVKSGFNVGSAVAGYLAAGVPASKLVLGVPFYGHGWAGVPATNDGLYQKATSIPPGSWEAGKFDYKDLAANYMGKYTRRWHDEAKVPWLYNAQTGIMITYDDPQSLAIKTDLIKARGLGGVMFWELSGDDAQSTLLNALNAGLK